MMETTKIQRIPYSYFAVRTELGIETVPVSKCQYADRVADFVEGKNILQAVHMTPGQQTFSTTLKHFEETTGIKSRQSDFHDDLGVPCAGWRVIPSEDVPGSLVQCLNHLSDFIFESSHDGYIHLKSRR